jgi:hypothetical protein
LEEGCDYTAEPRSFSTKETENPTTNGGTYNTSDDIGDASHLVISSSDDAG